MILTINTADLPSILWGIGIIIVIALGVFAQVLKSAGLTWTIIKTKLLIPYEAARLAKPQDNKKVIEKMKIPDDVIDFFCCIAPGDEPGTIDTESAQESFGDIVDLYNKKCKQENKKLKMLEMKK
jgi:hypothetical protein